MSPKLSAVLAAALLFGADGRPMQAQTPDIRSISPSDPRNAPLALNSDIRPIVGLTEGIGGSAQGVGGGPVGLKKPRARHHTWESRFWCPKYVALDVLCPVTR